MLETIIHYFPYVMKPRHFYKSDTKPLGFCSTKLKVYAEIGKGELFYL